MLKPRARSKVPASDIGLFKGLVVPRDDVILWDVELDCDLKGLKDGLKRCGFELVMGEVRFKEDVRSTACTKILHLLLKFNLQDLSDILETSGNLLAVCHVLVPSIRNQLCLASLEILSDLKGFRVIQSSKFTMLSYTVMSTVRGPFAAARRMAHSPS